MNQKKSFSVLLIVLLIVLAGAMFAYRYLSDKVTPNNTGSLLDQVAGTTDADPSAETVMPDALPRIRFKEVSVCPIISFL